MCQTSHHVSQWVCCCRKYTILRCITNINGILFLVVCSPQMGMLWIYMHMVVGVRSVSVALQNKRLFCFHREVRVSQKNDLVREKHLKKHILRHSFVVKLIFIWDFRIRSGKVKNITLFQKSIILLVGNTR